MDRGLGSDEPYSDILLRSEEFAESEKVSDITKTGEREVMDATNKAMNTKVSRGALDDTVHVLGDKVKEMVGQAGDMGQQTMEIAGDTVSNMLSRKVRDVASAGQEADSVNEDVRYSMDEGEMHTFKGKFDDVTREILDSTHHATNILTNTLQKAEVTGDTLKGVAAQAVSSVEDILADLDDKIKSSASYTGDSHARTESVGVTKIGNEDLIRLTDGSNNASQRDTGNRTVFPQSTHDANQDVGYPSSQQWGLDWRQYADEAASIGLHHFDREAEADVKTVHSADDSSAEESMFDRKGPLTIPHQSPEDTIQLDRDFNSPKQSGFEVAPRPPTPPKELDDEDVKPTTIDLGQTAGRLFVGGEHPSSILKNSTQGVRFNFKDMDARFLDIVYWRDPKKSGAILAITLLALLVLAKFPLIAVLSYVGLSVLGGTLGFRIYKLIEAQIRKTDGGNPYRTYLEDREFHLPKEKVHQQMDALIEHVQFIGNKLRRLFLVESIVDSIKFGLLLWALTYVSCWFSGLSLLILAILAVFTIPKVYEVYHEPIDRNIFIAKQHIDNANKMISEKIPFLTKSTAAAEISHEKSY